MLEEDHGQTIITIIKFLREEEYRKILYIILYLTRYQ
jgi:hypothetical protein